MRRGRPFPEPQMKTDRHRRSDRGFTTGKPGNTRFCIVLGRKLRKTAKKHHGQHFRDLVEACSTRRSHFHEVAEVRCTRYPRFHEVAEPRCMRAPHFREVVEACCTRYSRSHEVMEARCTRAPRFREVAEVRCTRYPRFRKVVEARCTRSSRFRKVVEARCTTSDQRQAGRAASPFAAAGLRMAAHGSAAGRGLPALPYRLPLVYEVGRTAAWLMECGSWLPLSKRAFKAGARSRTPQPVLPRPLTPTYFRGTAARRAYTFDQRLTTNDQRQTGRARVPSPPQVCAWPRMALRRAGDCQSYLIAFHAARFTKN